MLERFYRSLYRIRRVEEEIVRVYPTDRIMSPVHLSIGQEAICVGVCEALRPGDIVYGSYRSHALYLAKGGDLKGMIAELYGKITGCAKGKAGSMHLIDVAVGAMGASAVVATTIPQAVGHALAIQMRKEPKVVVAFFGDGAVEEGAFHESVNFATLRKLPIIFVCENNDFAIHSRQKDRQSSSDICALAKAHGLVTERIAEMDTTVIHEKVSKAAAEIRENHAGPRFFEIFCYRWMEHVGPGLDYDFGYRHKAEAEPWLAKDEVKRIAGLLDAGKRKKIEGEVEAEIKEAFAFAESSKFPDADELYTDVFSE